MPSMDPEDVAPTFVIVVITVQEGLGVSSGKARTSTNLWNSPALFQSDLIAKQVASTRHVSRRLSLFCTQHRLADRFRRVSYYHAISPCRITQHP